MLMLILSQTEFLFSNVVLFNQFKSVWHLNVNEVLFAWSVKCMLHVHMHPKTVFSISNGMTSKTNTMQYGEFTNVQIWSEGETFNKECSTKNIVIYWYSDLYSDQIFLNSLENVFRNSWNVFMIVILNYYSKRMVFKDWYGFLCKTMKVQFEINST